MQVKLSLGVFCGSELGNNPSFKNSAADLGQSMAEQGIRLVYGGGNIGLMGEIARASLAKGGNVVGVIPKLLVDKEMALADCTELKVTGSMHERKEMMYRLSDAFVVLPGGLGTLDEMFEALTWNRLGIHDKPLFLLNTSGFYDQIRTHLDSLLELGFIHSSDRKRIHVVEDPSELVKMALQLALAG